MVIPSGQDHPLLIKSVKTKRGVIDVDKKFIADEEDWLRGLTFRLDNRSGKTVTFVEILLTFWRAEDQVPGIPAGWPLRKGPDPFSITEFLGVPPQMEPVAPGREIEVVLSDLEYDEIKRFLRDVQFPNAIKKMEIEVVKIGFSDGSAWNVGVMYRRDPKNTNGPLKGWSPEKKIEMDNLNLLHLAVLEIALPFF